jgi:hypothetical protein
MVKTDDPTTPVSGAIKGSHRRRSNGSQSPMSFPSISIFSERSSPSRGRYAAPNTGAPLTAAGRSGAHPEMRGKAASRSRASRTGACGSLVFRLSRRNRLRFYAPVTTTPTSTAVTLIQKPHDHDGSTGNGTNTRLAKTSLLFQSSGLIGSAASPLLEVCLSSISSADLRT